MYVMGSESGRHDGKLAGEELYNERVFVCELDVTRRTIFVGARHNWQGGRVVADAAAGRDPHAVVGPLFQLVHQDVRLGRVDRDGERLRVRTRLLHHLDRQFPISNVIPI